MIYQNQTGQWSNRAEDLIGLEAYNPGWIDQFAQECRAIRECIDPSIPLVIEHIGSTAIPGLPAKPIIDILIGASPADWPMMIEALKGLAYVHWEDNPDPQREFLVKGMPPFGNRRTHHIHIGEVGGQLWEQLLFRDYLRAHAEERSAYAELKGRLAAEYPDDREAYTNGKDALVAEMMSRARAWQRA